MKIWMLRQSVPLAMAIAQIGATARATHSPFRPTQIVSYSEERLLGRHRRDDLTFVIHRNGYEKVIRAQSASFAASAKPSAFPGQRWMGTDFTYEDVVGFPSLSRDYTHQWVAPQKLDGEKAMGIECRPKANIRSSWSRMILWVRGRDWMPMKLDFFDQQGKRVRFLRFGRYQTVDGKLMPTLALAKSVENAERWTFLSMENTRLIKPANSKTSQFKPLHIKRASRRASLP